MQNIFDPLIKVYKTLYLFAYDITGNFGLALVLLSFFTFVVLYPFNKKAQQIQNKEHKIQTVLAPQIEKIKKRYSGREQYENLQWLYQRYSYHPLYAIRSALGLFFQLPFLTAAYYMLSGLGEIKGISWGIIPDLGSPDHLLYGINVLPFVMTMVTIVYAFVMPGISKKERMQTIGIGVFFLIILYSAPSALLIFWTCNLIWSLLDSVFSEKLEWIGDFIEENELAFHIIIALSLTVGLLIPTEIYIKNVSQLWFIIKDILKYFLLDTAKYFVILMFAYLFCKSKKVRIVYLSVLLGLLLGVFLQTHIISVDYGLFDGHEIEWDKYISVGIENTLIWFICLILPFVMFKRKKFDMVKINKQVKPFAFAIVVIQCIALLITLKNNPVLKDVSFENGKVGVLTTKDIYAVSSKDNIIVFLLDAFDAEVFEEIQKKNPEVLTTFSDFTYYPDTTSSFGFTIYSLPEILTGRLFDPSLQKYPDFLNYAFRNNEHYKALKNNHYIIDVYTSGDFVSQFAPISNLVSSKVVLDKEMLNKFASLAKFRMVPHYLKRFYYKYDPNLQGSMIANKAILMYRFDDIRFYQDLKQGLSITENGNRFKFYHLEGLHYPWVVDENMQSLKAGEKGTAYKAAIGKLKIVNEFIRQMQSLQIYDNATIAILADHGENYALGRRPLFMIKQPNSHQEMLAVNERMSTVSDLLTFVCERFDDKQSANNPTFNKRIRGFYLEDKNGNFIKYAVQKNAQQQASWNLIGKIEKYRGGDQSYCIGDVIDFSLYGNSARYKGEGWKENPNIRYSDIAAFEADMHLNIINEIDHDKYLLKIRVHPLISAFNMPYKTLSLFANGTNVGKWKFDRDDFKEVSCKIPKEILHDRRLNLLFVVEVPEHFTRDEGVNANAKFAVDKMQIFYE